MVNRVVGLGGWVVGWSIGWLGWVGGWVGVVGWSIGWLGWVGGLIAINSPRGCGQLLAMSCGYFVAIW